MAGCMSMSLLAGCRIKVKVSVTPDNEYATLLGTTLSGGSDAVDIFMHAAGSQM